MKDNDKTLDELVEIVKNELSCVKTMNPDILNVLGARIVRRLIKENLLNIK